jgi:hypothetical protein
MLCRVALVRTDVSEESSASIIRLTRISELGTTLAVTCNRRTSQKTAFFRVTALKSSNIRLFIINNDSTLIMLWIGYFFSFVILREVGRTHWTSDQTVARPQLHRVRHEQNKRTQLYPCLQWKPKPRSWAVSKAGHSSWNDVAADPNSIAVCTETLEKSPHTTGKISKVNVTYNTWTFKNDGWRKELHQNCVEYRVKRIHNARNSYVSHTCLLLYTHWRMGTANKRRTQHPDWEIT